MIERSHPLTLLIYFLSAALLPAFSKNPLLHGLALITGILMLLTWTDIRKILKRSPFYLLFFVIISLFNPFFYHNGNTVLFYMSGRRITLEALLYGADAALMVTGVLIWFISFSHYMTSDKVLWIFGGISKKAALIISLILRLIPHYSAYIRTYRAHQKLLGIYGEGSFIERVRAEGKIFAGFLTWALEHSMTTSDSMAARGYGIAKRKPLSLFSLRACDVYVILSSLTGAAIMTAAFYSGAFSIEYYPSIIFSKPDTISFLSIAVYITYSCLLQIRHLYMLKKENYEYTGNKGFII